VEVREAKTSRVERRVARQPAEHRSESSVAAHFHRGGNVAQVRVSGRAGTCPETETHRFPFADNSFIGTSIPQVDKRSAQSLRRNHVKRIPVGSAPPAMKPGARHVRADPGTLAHFRRPATCPSIEAPSTKSPAGIDFFEQRPLIRKRLH